MSKEGNLREAAKYVSLAYLAIEGIGYTTPAGSLDSWVRHLSHKADGVEHEEKTIGCDFDPIVHCSGCREEWRRRNCICPGHTNCPKGDHTHVNYCPVHGQEQ